MPLTQVDQIIVRKRLRNIDPKKVEKLAESISEIGLINPIQINGRTLIAGAHRLAATKLLGINTIITNSVGINGDDDSFRLIEIDENLFRNELSASEKALHITERIEIIKRKKISEFNNKGIVIDKKLMVKIENEAKDEISEILGVSLPSINKKIADYKSITNVNLDENKLESLSESQYKRVADVAKKEGKDAASSELDIQLKKIKGESSVSHDLKKHVKTEIQSLRSARSVCKKYNNQNAIDAINELINTLNNIS